MAHIGNLKKLRLNVFPGGFNWPVFVAQNKGIFEKNCIDIEIQNTRGSVDQMRDFIEEKCDIVMTGFDNIVAYSEGHGELPLGPQTDLFAFLGSDNSFLSLVVAKEVLTFTDLKNTTIAVDAITTGYSFALFEMLAISGLPPGEYDVERVGGMLQRIEDLRRGGHPATLLSSPYDIIAALDGFKVLAYAKDVLGEYQGNVAATRKKWALQNPGLLTSFASSYLEALRWLGNPNNSQEAQEILRAHVGNISHGVADSSYRHMLDPVNGFFLDGRLREDGINTVLALRRRYGKGPNLFDGKKYIDFSFWNAASGELARRQN